MNRKEFLHMWAIELASGKWLQGKSYLKVEDKDGIVRYCCLGVAEEIGQREKLSRGFTHKREMRDGSIHYGVEQDPNEAGLSEELQAFLGLSSLGHIEFPEFATFNWQFEGYPPNVCLSAVNDHDRPFTEIAAQIRKYADSLE